MTDDDWFPLEELTGRLAGLVWVENQLAALLNGWSSVEADQVVCVALATTAAHHRWHAGQLTSCLATSPALAEQSAPAPPTQGWAAAAETLAAQTDADQTWLRLAAIVRVLDPWVARETGAIAALSTPTTDAALLRWLRFIEIDHRDDAMTELFAARRSDTIRLADQAVLASLDLA